MKEQIEHRLQSLTAEFRAGQEMLAELEAKKSHLHMTLARISGAMQVLEELLSQGPADVSSPANGEPLTTAPTATRDERADGHGRY
jgi:predicted nuclease with TOPRIM domain